MRILSVFLILSLSACSIAPQTPSAVQYAETTRLDPQKNPLTKWELDLLLNLWFHLIFEESRLEGEIRIANNSEDVKSLKIMLVTVRSQSDETWQLLFSNLR